MTTRADRLRRFDAELMRTHDVLLLGLDEVGRGCLAGPVVAAAVVLPPGARLPGVDDSKRLAPGPRAEQERRVRAAAFAVAWSFVGPRAIEAGDIRRASLAAMRTAARRAVTLLRARHPAAADRLLAVVDGIDAVPGLELPQHVLIEGDGTSRAVAAASVVAKVVRDRFMERLDRDHPAYGFAQHKGYGTPEHLAALARVGPCAWHRHTFRPVVELSLPFEPLDAPVTP